MARGDNPNSRANLKVPTSSEARKNGKKGGKASAEARRLYADLRECYEKNVDDQKRKAIIDMLINRAEHGNLKALEILLKIEKEKNPDELRKLEIKKLKLEIEEQRLRVEMLKHEMVEEDTETEDSFLKALEGSAADDWAEDIADEETATEDQV